MEEEAIQAQRRRHQVAFMDDDAIAIHRRRNRIDSMEEEAIQAQRHRHQVAFMDEDTLAVQRDRDRIRDANRPRRRPHVTLAQEWDYDNPCEHCYCLFLKSEPKSFRKYCCHNGDYLYGESEFPRLNQLPHFLVNELVFRCGLSLKNVTTGEIFTPENSFEMEHILGKRSNKYNNILSLGNKKNSSSLYLI